MYYSEHTMEYQEQLGWNDFETNQDLIQKSRITNETVDPIKYFDSEGQAHVLLTDGPYLPLWQTSPLLQRRMVNENLLTRHSNNDEASLPQASIDLQQAVLGGFTMAPYGDASHQDPMTAEFATLRSIVEEQPVRYLGEPMTYFYVPILDEDKSYDDGEQQHEHDTPPVTALLMSILHWRSYFRQALPASIPSIMVVLESTCPESDNDSMYTYEIQGPEAYIVGVGDHHDDAFDEWQKDASFGSQHLRDGTVQGLNISQDVGCQYNIAIYPTQIFMDTFLTDTPLAITFAIAIVFLFTICMFLLYDRYVHLSFFYGCFVWHIIIIGVRISNQ